MVRKSLSLSVSNALFMFGGAVLIEDAAAQQNQQTESDEVLMEEITITARKREETLQDVPISVAARTVGQIRQNGLTSLEDISQTVASFSVQNLGPGQSVVAIHGSSAGKQDRNLPGIKVQVCVPG